MATEAEKKAFAEQLKDPGQLPWLWEQTKPLISKFKAQLPRINAHVFASHSIPHIEALVRSESVPLEKKHATMREVYVSLVRYMVSEEGTKPLPDGKAWDCDLKGAVPAGQVAAAPEPVAVAPTVADNVVPMVDTAKPAEPAPEAPAPEVEAEELSEEQEMERMAKKLLEQAKVKREAREKAQREASEAEARRRAEEAAKPKAPAVDVGQLKAEVIRDVTYAITAKLDPISDKLNETRRFLEGVDSDNKAVGKWSATMDEMVTKIAKSVEELKARPASAAADPEAVAKLVNEALSASFGQTMGMILANRGPAILPSAGGAIEAEKEDTKKAIQTGLFFPKPDASYHVDDDMLSLMEHVNGVRKVTPQNIGLVGPHGCGKTEWAIQFAARYGLGCLIMDAANVREPRDWFGYRDYDGSRLIWRRSLFDMTVSEGNCVVVLDELPRAVSTVLNTLFPILDARRFTYLEEKGDVIRVGPGLVFVATMNEGMQYTGNNTLDAALSDRFPRRVEVNYLAPGDEAQVLIQRTGITEDDAMKLADLALTIRQKSSGMGATLTKTLSTRQLLAAAHEFKHLGVKGLRYCITNHFSAEGGDASERAQVLQMMQGKFGDV